MNHISIFVLGGQAISREGLRTLIRAGSNLSVVGEAETIEQMLHSASTVPIEAVLVDLPLPICSLNATRRILSISPAAHVLVLSDYANEPNIAKIITTELRHVGASALLPKTISATELVAAIHRVIKGDAVFPQPVHSRLTPSVDGTAIVDQASLTLRQTQVLKMVAEGLANKEIADRLSISPKTVEKHRQSVKDKLRTNNAADLARRAIHLGLVQAA